jgi:hypothetical protein
MNPKCAAKEWLYLLGFFLFGVSIFPAIFFSIAEEFVAPSDTLGKFYGEFYRSLFNRDAYTAWSIAFGPYVLFQFTRSVIWALKTVKRKGA